MFCKVQQTAGSVFKSLQPTTSHYSAESKYWSISPPQYPSYLKTSLTINTTNNLAKLKEMLPNLFFKLSSIKTMHPVVEICKPHVQWKGI